MTNQLASSRRLRVVVLAGGFGGARMAHGFALLGGDIDLSVIVNTGDDLELHGLSVSPDLDTVMYTLAGLANDETGWGVRDETWSASEMLERYGRPTWFGLGDRDLATHVVRTQRMRDGRRLTRGDRASWLRRWAWRAAAAHDATTPVRTELRTADGWLDFQDYFVRRGQRDAVLEVRRRGIETARPTAEVAGRAIAGARPHRHRAVQPVRLAWAPSWPCRACSRRCWRRRPRCVAVSPIVGGKALRGPADRDARVARRASQRRWRRRAHYAERYPGLVDAFVLDEAERGREPRRFVPPAWLRRPRHGRCAPRPARLAEEDPAAHLPG